MRRDYKNDILLTLKLKEWHDAQHRERHRLSPTVMKSHINHVLEHVIPDGNQNGFDADGWAEVAHAIRECNLLCCAYPYKESQIADAEQRLSDFCWDNGYQGCRTQYMSDEDVFERHRFNYENMYRWMSEAGQYKYFEWEKATSKYFGFDETNKPDMSKLLPDDIVDYHVATGKPWTIESNHAVNQSIHDMLLSSGPVDYVNSLYESMRRIGNMHIDDLLVENTASDNCVDFDVDNKILHSLMRSGYYRYLQERENETNAFFEKQKEKMKNVKKPEPKQSDTRMSERRLPQMADKLDEREDTKGDFDYE